MGMDGHPMYSGVPEHQIVPLSGKDIPLQLPVDEDDYLQPKSAHPAAYMDLNDKGRVLCVISLSVGLPSVRVSSAMVEPLHFRARCQHTRKLTFQGPDAQNSCSAVQ